VSGEETVTWSEAARFQRDLSLYLRVAREMDGPPLTTRGYVSRPALRRVRATLQAADGRAQAESDADLAEVDDGRLFFVRRLLERLSLLTKDEASERATQRLVVAAPDQIAAYFARPLAERLRICARGWVAGGWWLDTPDTRGAVPSVMSPAAPRIALVRRRLIEWLATMRPSESGTLPDATHGGSAGKSRNARVRQVKRLPEGDDGEIARAALLGPLAWLGFVRNVDEKSGAFIAEEACRALAPSADTEVAEAHGRVMIQPDFSIVAYPPLTAPLLVALDLYADLERLDRVARYKLSRVALARSGRGSWDASALAERLERLTQAPLPDNIHVTLRDWQRRGERLRAVEDASVIEVDDAKGLDELLADHAAHGWIERRLSATAALITPGHSAEVRAWLLRHGELPATLLGLGGKARAI
jgi:hypothetical protein